MDRCSECISATDGQVLVGARFSQSNYLAGLRVEDISDVTTGLWCRNGTHMQLNTMSGLRSLSVVVGLFASILASASPANAQDPSFLYVCNQGNATVSIIDMESHEVVETLDLKALGFDANAKPHHVAVEADGSHWYLSLIAAGRVLKFTRDNELIGQAEFSTPGMLAIHPTEDILYVGRSMAAVNPPPSIGLIRRSDMTIEELDVFFARPHAIAVRKQGDFAYSASLAMNQLASIDTETDALELVNLEGPTHTLVQFAMTPNGKTMVATAQLTGLLFVFNLENPARPVVSDTIEVGRQPWHPSVSTDSDLVFVPAKESNAVVVVSLQHRMAMAEIQGRGIAQPHGSVLSPDGKWLFVSNNNMNGDHMADGDAAHEGAVGTVVVIDTKSFKIEKVIEVGPNATGIGAARTY